ncbi:NAD(P)H-dependent oxidoreductase [Roseovarius sp. CAU 1744]|uniref:FMN-dependent NADH-azoreductase n=1 Tax=Roseovarius sp. CAU 1744 TaxID=3140368 RepID=UPI00325BACF5
MTRILRIDASSRPAIDLAGGEGSYSRALADRIVSELEAKYPGADVVHRDLAVDPIPHIAEATIKGFYTPVDALTDDLRDALVLSHRVIAEVKAADAIVISAPIYNFSIPSALKAWIDHVLRIGHTFAYEDGQFQGLVEDRPVYLALSYGAGGYGDGGPLQSYDQMKPYLTMILNFIGLTSVTALSIEATTADAATIAAEREKAFAATRAALAA